MVLGWAKKRAYWPRAPIWTSRELTAIKCMSSGAELRAFDSGTGQATETDVLDSCNLDRLVLLFDFWCSSYEISIALLYYSLVQLHILAQLMFLMSSIPNETCHPKRLTFSVVDSLSHIIGFSQREKKIDRMDVCHCWWIWLARSDICYLCSMQTQANTPLVITLSYMNMSISTDITAKESIFTIGLKPPLFLVVAVKISKARIKISIFSTSSKYRYYI